MKKLLIICMFITLFALNGCADKQTNETTTETTNEEAKNTEEKIAENTFTDQYGYEVTIPNDIKRVGIVQLLPLPAVFSAYQGGNVDNLVFMPPDSLNAAKNSILKDYAPKILDVSTKPLENGQISIEEILNLSPDIIFYSGKDNHELFESAGIPSVGFSTVAGGKNPIKTVSLWIEQLEQVFQKESKLTGVSEYGEKVMQDVSDRTSVLSEKDRKKVMIISTFNDSAMNVQGFSEYWVTAINGINIAQDAPNGSTNMEQVYEWNPDVIFLSSLTDVLPEDLYNNTAPNEQDWSEVTAVKNKAVYKFPTGIHRWWPPTPESPLSLYWQAKIVYPELFEDINMDELTKKYFKDFLNMELSSEQLSSIFSPNKELGISRK